MADGRARILLWGIEGAGSTTSLQTIHAKLRPELRGDIRLEPTRLDPTVHYEVLPITLGDSDAAGTQLEIIAVPGAPDQAMTRKQLLDGTDGIVIVLDASPQRIDANYKAIEELRASLAAYGQRLDTFPIVLQYNKRDIADPFAIEELHRRVGLDKAAVFETIATSGHGILATLTTISKHVVRARRMSGNSEIAKDAAPNTAQTATELEYQAGSSHEILEAAILADDTDNDGAELAELIELEPIDTAQPNWDSNTELVAGPTRGDTYLDSTSNADSKPEASLGEALHIVSAGQAEVDADGSLRLPLVLGDEAGLTRTVVLTLRLDALTHDGED
jgi:signal recognition particle receptor subunit beta